MKRKAKIRWGSLGAVAATIGGTVLTVLSNPAVLASAAGKIGISATVLGGIVAGLKKALVREDHERD